MSDEQTVCLCEGGLKVKHVETRVGFTGICIVLGLAVMMCTGWVGSEQPRVVRVERLEVLDSAGNVRVEMDGSASHGSVIRVLDQSGDCRFRVDVSAEGTYVLLGPQESTEYDKHVLLAAAGRVIAFMGGYPDARAQWQLTGDEYGAGFSLNEGGAGPHIHAGYLNAGIKLIDWKGRTTEVAKISKEENEK